MDGTVLGLVVVFVLLCLALPPVGISDRLDSRDQRLMSSLRRPL